MTLSMPYQRTGRPIRPVVGRCRYESRPAQTVPARTHVSNGRPIDAWTSETRPANDPGYPHMQDISARGPRGVLHARPSFAELRRAVSVA
jgi:hypothetical protein